MLCTSLLISTMTRNPSTAHTNGEQIRPRAVNPLHFYSLLQESPTNLVSREKNKQYLHTKDDQFPHVLKQLRFSAEAFPKTILDTNVMLFHRLYQHIF